MLKIQSWWEVPAIAHFCHIFRDAFNLFYFEIAELEAAILQVQAPELCISLEQLAIRLLQVQYPPETVTAENWEKKLYELFQSNSIREKNLLAIDKSSFQILNPRSKVEILFKLCNLLLNSEDTLDAIKDIDSDEMRAKCVGKDSDNNIYWYFCDDRLYKENTKKSTQKNKKLEISSYECKQVEQNLKRKNQSKTKKQGNFFKQKKALTAKKENNEDIAHIKQTWSVVCFSIYDWEQLVKKLSKSKNPLEKELIKEIKRKYLPMLQEVVAEKARLLRKRFLELAPKRTSLRISEVQAKKKIKEQIAIEAAEHKKMKLKEELAKKESEKKRLAIEERKKRAAERERLIEECANKARNYIQSFPDEDTNNSLLDKHKEQSKNSKMIQGIKDNKNDFNAQTSESDSNNYNDSDSDYKEPFSNSKTNKKQTTQISHNLHVNNRLIHVSSFSKWQSNFDTKGQKVHIFQEDCDKLCNKKRLCTDESIKFGNQTSQDLPSNSYKKDKITLCTPHVHKIAYRNSSSSPVIRLDFIKTNHQTISS